MATSSVDRRPLLPGFVVGIAAWLVGYAVTYLVVAPGVRDSGLNRLVDALNGQPATTEMVGWVFFNAHFVDTVVHGIPFVGSRTTAFIGGDNGFTAALYLIPPVVLVLGGALLTRYVTRDGDSVDVFTGATLLSGYALASLVGAFAFEVSVGSAVARPDLVPAIALAGIAYPVVFGTAGSLTASLLHRERTNTEP